MIELIIKPANDGRHKFLAIFWDPKSKSIQNSVPFGAKGYEDYTHHGNSKRRELYIARHSKNNQDWENPYSAGALSRWILWEYKDIDTAIKNYKKKFGFA